MSITSEVIYTLDSIYVATLNSDNSYGTPQEFQYAQDFSYDPQHDSDEIKSAGDIVERIEILTAIEATVNNAQLSWAARAIITGDTLQTSSGGSGQLKTMDLTAGGAGTPYVGVVAVFNVQNSHKFVAGIPKCKATKPSFSAEQNSFVAHELNFKSVRAGAGAIHLRPRLYETVDDLPDFATAAGFDDFFSGIFS